MKDRTSRFISNQISEIRALYGSGWAIAYIARKFNCCPNAIWNQVFDLSIPLTENRINSNGIKQRKLSNEDIRKIRSELIENNIRSPEIAKKYKISQSTAYQ